MERVVFNVLKHFKLDHHQGSLSEKDTVAFAATSAKPSRSSDDLSVDLTN